MSEEISVGELARRFAEVVVRLDGLARRLEDGQFVRTDLYVEARTGIYDKIDVLGQRISAIENSKADKGVEERIKKLEDSNTWLIRLVISFVVLGVLGAVFAASGGLVK